MVRGSSPLMASRATLALNTGEWLRLGLLGIVHTPPGRVPWSSITYRAVQFRPATSFSLAMLVLPEATQRLFDSFYLSSPEGSRVFGEAVVSLGSSNLALRGKPQAVIGLGTGAMVSVTKSTRD